MANELVFEIEKVPDIDTVFMRAHRTYFRYDTLMPGVFRHQGNGMSVNWSKYSSPEHTHQQAKEPHNNAVIALLVEGVRKIRSLDVQHTPKADNRAHCDIVLPANKEDLTEVRLLLLRLATIPIPCAIKA